MKPEYNASNKNIDWKVWKIRDASGMPTLVAGVQEQLDAWIAENGLQTSESAASSDTAPMTGETEE